MSPLVDGPKGEPRTRYAEALDARRLKAGLTVEALASRSGVGVDTVLNIVGLAEGVRRPVTLTTRIRMNLALTAAELASLL